VAVKTKFVADVADVAIVTIITVVTIVIANKALSRSR
jgi:hypothetical protein